jgi:hypothetical protein
MLKLADRRGDIRCGGAGAATWVLLRELEGTWFDLGSPIDARNTSSITTRSVSFVFLPCLCGFRWVQRDTFPRVPWRAGRPSDRTVQPSGRRQSPKHVRADVSEQTACSIIESTVHLSRTFSKPGRRSLAIHTFGTVRLAPQAGTGSVHRQAEVQHRYARPMRDVACATKHAELRFDRAAARNPSW